MDNLTRRRWLAPRGAALLIAGLWFRRAFAASPPMIVTLTDGQTAYNQLVGALRNAQTITATMQQQITANAVVAQTVLNVLAACANTIQVMLAQTGETLTLMQTYYAAQTGASQAGLTASGTATYQALLAVIAAIKADFPQSGGFLQDQQFNASGGVIVSPATYPASQFPTTATALTAWLATIQ